MTFRLISIDKSLLSVKKPGKVNLEAVMNALQDAEVNTKNAQLIGHDHYRRIPLTSNEEVRQFFEQFESPIVEIESRSKGGDLSPKASALSCKRIMTQAGYVLAVPHYSAKKMASQQSSGSSKMATVSINRSDYSVKNIVKTSCGAKEKPLQPYKPNAHRSRLDQGTQINQGRNDSSIEFGDTAQNIRRFVTNHKNYYRRFTDVISSNPAISAQKTRWFHHLQIQ